MFSVTGYKTVGANKVRSIFPPRALTILAPILLKHVRDEKKYNKELPLSSASLIKS